MEQSADDLYFYVRLKKNYSKQDIIKGQHFRFVCDNFIKGDELTYQEKLALLNTDGKCIIDPEKYDKYEIPFGYAIVDCKDLEDITKEVLEKGLLFFTDSSFFGDKDGREEIQRKEDKLMKYIDDLPMFKDVSDDTDLEEDESVKEKDTLKKE